MVNDLSDGRAVTEDLQGSITTLITYALGEPLAFTEARRERIKQLLDSGHDIDAEDVLNGKTALTLSVEVGDMALFRMLLDRGANVNARAYSNERGSSVLDEAAYFGRLKMVRLLLERGAEAKHHT